MSNVTHFAITVVAVISGGMFVWFFLWYLYDSFTKPDIAAQYKPKYRRNNANTNRYKLPKLPWWRRYWDAFAVAFLVFVITALSSTFALIMILGLFKLFG